MKRSRYSCDALCCISHTVTVLRSASPGIKPQPLSSEADTQTRASRGRLTRVLFLSDGQGGPGVGGERGSGGCSVSWYGPMGRSSGRANGTSDASRPAVAWGTVE
ncbi:hypothetical protein SHKM778_54250 [Streptomyces sp. KM77-8]|uniref:Uncharacterized protein n=1 Tax=Streptomyces haneummycinicus TaxID=3074435 RepID=A0AAT9HN96_9ACTN